MYYLLLPAPQHGASTARTPTLDRPIELRLDDNLDAFAAHLAAARRGK